MAVLTVRQAVRNILGHRHFDQQHRCVIQFENSQIFIEVSTLFFAMEFCFMNIEMFIFETYAKFLLTTLKLKAPLIWVDERFR